MIKPQAQHVQLCMMGSIENVVSDPNIQGEPLCGPSQLLPKCVSVLKLRCTFATANI